MHAQRSLLSAYSGVEFIQAVSISTWARLQNITLHAHVPFLNIQSSLESGTCSL
jgi:hypothetical protein